MLALRPYNLVWLAGVALLYTLIRLIPSTQYHQYLSKNNQNIPYPGPEYTPNDQPQHNLLSYNDARDHCRRRRLSPYTTRDRPRKVYDLFLINTELDWAEIRLNELNDEVDYFIIVESSQTFQEMAKPLYFADQVNTPTFQKFASKIIHRVVDFTGTSFKEGDTWAREHFTRNSLLDQALASLEGEQAPRQGDVLVVGDVDEVPRPGTLTTLRNCAIPPRVTLRSHMYYYSFQWLHRGDWLHPQATYFSGPDTLKPEDLRSGAASGKKYFELYNAAWHCSCAMQTLELLKNKIMSFSHKAYNHPYILNETKLVNRIRGGEDIFERKEEAFDRVERNGDVPEFLRREENRERFLYMLDRDPGNANFRDVVV